MTKKRKAELAALVADLKAVAAKIDAILAEDAAPKAKKSAKTAKRKFIPRRTQKKPAPIVAGRNARPARHGRAAL